MSSDNTSPFAWKGQAAKTLTARDRQPYKKPVEVALSSHISIAPCPEEDIKNKQFVMLNREGFGSKY